MLFVMHGPGMQTGFYELEM